MAAAMDAEKWSYEYKDDKCSICTKKNKNVIADHYCYDCKKHLCTSCLGTHIQCNENHNVLQGLKDGKDVLTEKCGKHADELITLYCHQHDELLCRKCRHFDHRKCQDPQNIRKSSDERNADPELQTVPEQLKSALDNINKAIEALDKHVANIQQSGNSFLKDLEDYAKKLLSRIEELRKKGKKDIKSKQEELLSVAKQHRQTCALTKDELSQCLDKITKSANWNANMFVLIKKGQTIAKKVESLYNDSESLIKRCHINLLPDMKIFDSLNFFNSLIEEDGTKVQNVSSQCAVKGKVDRPIQAKLRRPGEKQGEMPVVSPGKKTSVENPRYSTQVRKINIRIPEDKTDYRISGCCHLSDGSLMVVDNTNRRLKLLDPSSNTVTKYCDTDRCPADVCCIGPQEVAVVFNRSTQVHVYNTVNLCMTRTVELNHQAIRIACHGGLLYCGGGEILYVHDLIKGRTLREISKNTNGYNLFYSITRIVVNRSGDRVYVTDRYYGLACVSTDGQVIFRLSQDDLGLTYARGMTTDHHGHVFVCGLDSHNVVKVTEDGHVVGQIVSKEDGILGPHCLSYDVSRSCFYVGGTDQLLMVELKKSLS